MRRWIWLLVILVAGLCLGTVGVAVWASNPAEPETPALAALDPGGQVAVQLEPWIAFVPEEPKPTGLILYPGGRVDPRAYAAAGRAIAEAGFLTVIPPMPLNLAVLAPDRALEVMQAYPEIERWVIGGHSLGGAMAARFVRQHPDRVAGLLLWAAYPSGSDDLSGSGLAAASISGSEDGLSDRQTLIDTRRLLPPNTAFVEIAGGNHAQFGDYGPQSGDRPAKISATEQQARVVAATLALLERLSPGPP